MLSRIAKSPPGPPGWPILGCLLEIDFSRMHDSFDQWAKQYGSLILCKMATKALVVISCPRLVKKGLAEKSCSDVLNDRQDTFVSKYIMDNAKGVLFGKYGQTTTELRKIMYKGLNTHCQAAPQFEIIARKELERLINNVADQRGRDFNPNELVSSSIANIVAILLSGSVADEKDAEVIWEYNKAMRKSIEVTTDSMLLTFPFLRFLPVEVGRRYRRTMQAKEDLLKKFFHSNKETYEAGRERGLVDILLKLKSQEKLNGDIQWLTDSNIKAIIQDIIFGGLGSITYGILSLLLTLLHHHECVDGIYQEIVKVIGLDRCPSLQDRPAMPYTEAVILETLRYITPVPVSGPHRAMEDVELEGYTIPKEATIMINIWTIHHDTAIWGDPWTFRPKRFLDDNGELLPEDHTLRQSLVNFGSGPRSCVGENLARSRIFLYLTTLVQTFDLLPPEVGTLISDDPRTFLPGGVLRPPDYKMRAVAR
ncbi:hypothetical protein CHS0354_008339 [Potamilus streckersoni]|uniref:Cytochrome P450 n=1 Tax=Potamilus streckersoni TaxID=2493646 RepID=A0AAE0VTA8_9BIVA|nr:hypothetical protein CHS0354_008339 [Potamilus streckersoni]